MIVNLFMRIVEWMDWVAMDKRFLLLIVKWIGEFFTSQHTLSTSFLLICFFVYWLWFLQ